MIAVMLAAANSDDDMPTQSNERRRHGLLPALLAVLFVLGLISSIIGRERRKQAAEAFKEMPILAMSGATIQAIEKKLGVGEKKRFGSIELWGHRVGKFIVCGSVEGGRLVKPIQFDDANRELEVRWGFASWLSGYANDRTVEEVQATLGQGEMLGSGSDRFWLYETDAELHVVARVGEGRLSSHYYGVGGRDAALERTLQAKSEAGSVGSNQDSSVHPLRRPSP